MRPHGASYGVLLWPGAEEYLTKDSVACDGLEIKHEPFHHRVSWSKNKCGCEVRFPGDWREPRGFSYFAVDAAQWGNLAQWQPIEGTGRLRLTLLPPLRYDRQPQRATEIFLPDGMSTAQNPEVTLEGKPWPKNVLPVMANGKPTTLEAEYGD